MLIGADGKFEVRRLADSQIGQQLAWRTRIALFARQPLGEALVVVDRYSPSRIVVDDLVWASLP